MSMSIFIRGIADAEKWRKAKEARETLVKLGIEYPDELDDIIDDTIKLPVNKVPSDYEDIWELDVKDIPKNVTKVRFIVSY